MQDIKKIQAQIKFDLRKVNLSVAPPDHSINGGSGTPSCGGSCRGEDDLNRYNPKTNK